MKVLLLRHTRVAVPPGVCYGATDVAPAVSFPVERELVRAALGAFDGLVISSPLQRCLTLARSLAPAVRVDERLREFNFGNWEMRPWEEIPRSEVDSWCDDFSANPPPGGERLRDFEARCADALAAARVLAAGRPLLLCTHAGVIRALLGASLGLSSRTSLTLDVGYGCIYDLDTGLRHDETVSSIPAGGRA